MAAPPYRGAAQPALANPVLTPGPSLDGGTSFADVAKGIRSITRNFAASGFNQNERFREQSAAGLAEDEAAAEAEHKFFLQQTFQRLQVLTEAAQQAGSISPGLAAQLEREKKRLEFLTGDAGYAEQEVEFAKTVAASAPQSDVVRKHDELSALGWSEDEIKEAMGGRIAPAGPQSSLAKLKADLDAGAISPEDYASAVKKETYIAPQTPTQPTELQEWKRAFVSENGREPSAAEIANRGKSPPTVSPSDVIGPLLLKKSQGEPLTPAQNETLEFYRQQNPLAALLGGLTPQTTAAGTSQDSPVTVASPEEAAKLAPGTWFQTPDGRIIKRGAQ